MYRYQTIIVHLESLIKDSNSETIEGVLRELNSTGYRLCNISRIEKKDKINGINESQFSIVKTYNDELEFPNLTKQILGETECTSAILLSCNEGIYNAANQTGCLSIGTSLGDGINPDFRFEKTNSIPNIINKINTVFSNISNHIRIKKHFESPLIVGVNGVDTSGKTEFSTELSRYLGKQGIQTEVVRIDDFHNESKVRYSEDDPVKSYYNNAFNLEKVESDLLKPIVKQKHFIGELNHLDLETDTYSKTRKYRLDNNSVLIVEGVLLYRDPIDKYFDVRIFLDVTFDEVLRRAQIRDQHIFGDNLLNKYKSKYIPVQELYIDRVKPRKICDIHIDNEDYNNPIILKNMIETKEESELTLIPVEEKYLNELHEIQSDQEAITMLGVIDLPKLSDYEGAKAYVIKNRNDEVIGQVELFNISWRNRRAELSIGIKQSHRKKGYGLESINRILEIGFNELGLYRIWLRVLEINTPAIKLYEKIGFVKEGVCRSESMRNGKYINQVQMSFLLPEWIGK